MVLKEPLILLIAFHLYKNQCLRYDFYIFLPDILRFVIEWFIDIFRQWCSTLRKNPQLLTMENP